MVANIVTVRTGPKILGNIYEMLVTAFNSPPWQYLQSLVDEGHQAATNTIECELIVC
jgi:hypothetical protein